MHKRANFLFTIIKVILNAITVYYSFVSAYWLRFNISIIPVTKGVPDLNGYIQAMPVVILIFLGAFKWAGFYNSSKGHVFKTDEFIDTVKAVALAIIITTAATFIYREYSYSRLVIAYGAVITTAAVFLLNIFLKFLKTEVFMPATSKIGILVIGGEQKTRRTFIKNASRFNNLNIYHRKECDLGQIKEEIKNKKIDEVILADTGIENNIVLSLINFCESKNIEFKMIPDLLELKMGELSYDEYFGLPVLELKHPLFEPANYYMKRSFDIVISMLCLIISAPLLVAVMILIKITSPGPVIYSHLRKGYKGRDFPFYKFRSMVENADKLLAKLMKHNERSGSAFKMKNDPRVTSIGKFIRKYSIDEMPQIFNVLKGDMSLVGPRPQVLWETENYDDTAKRRLNILPGVTGLWQVSGRSDLSFDEMIQLDIYYLENWTLGFDLKILLKTIPVVVLKKGAC